jgi:hypothetical protein
MSAMEVDEWAAFFKVKEENQGSREFDDLMDRTQ